MVRTLRGQFPRACTTCARVFETPRDFLETTEAIGRPLFDPIDADGEDTIGVLCFRNCTCGSTLGLAYEDREQHSAFNQAVRAEAGLWDRDTESILVELVALVNEQAKKSSKATKKSAVQADTMMQDVGAAIVQMVARGEMKIPAYSAVALKVQEVVRRPSYGLQDLARLVALDQSLAVNALRLANSSFYGRDTQVTALPVAITRIGAEEVERLAMATALAAETKGSGVLAAVRRQLWHQSLTSAVICRYLAKERGLQPDTAFACGLLHDIGSLIIALNLDLYMSKHKELPAKPASWWLRLIEHFHVEVGILAAQRWSLPKIMRDVIGMHHSVSRDGAEDPEMIDVVGAGDAVAYMAAKANRVSAEDLEAIPHLRTARERGAIADALPECPELIASLEPDTVRAPKRARARKNEKGQSLFVNETRPNEAYEAVELAPDRFVLRGMVPLVESFLTKFRVTDSLTFWAKTEVCERLQNGEVLVTLSPFALDAEAQKGWLATIAESYSETRASA